MKNFHRYIFQVKINTYLYYIFIYNLKNNVLEKFIIKLKKEQLTDL